MNLTGNAHTHTQTARLTGNFIVIWASEGVMKSAYVYRVLVIGWWTLVIWVAMFSFLIVTNTAALSCCQLITMYH